MKNPNNNLWQNYDAYAALRGELVALLLSRFVPLEKAYILDVGCGTGGIAVTLARHGANVTAIEVDEKKRQRCRDIVYENNMQIDVFENLTEADTMFDAVLLVDVIEHVLQPKKLLQTCFEKLKPDGIVYLTTPNKFSPLNMFCDPHFSLPLVSTLDRKKVKRIISSCLHWQPEDRRDFPELFSFHQLSELLTECGFNWGFVNQQVFELALDCPYRLWNRNSHVKMIEFLKKKKLTSIFKCCVNDKKAGFNTWLNPTWFIIAKKGVN